MRHQMDLTSMFLAGAGVLRPLPIARSTASLAVKVSRAVNPIKKRTFLLARPTVQSPARKRFATAMEDVQDALGGNGSSFEDTRRRRRDLAFTVIHRFYGRICKAPLKGLEEEMGSARQTTFIVLR